MNPIFIKREVNFLATLLGFTFLFFGIHWYILFHFFNEIDLILPLWTIYGFHFITVFFVYSILNFKESRGNKQVFILFMGATLFKMILTIVFLLPILLKPNDNATLEVINFFIPYFFYLALEIVQITFFLKNN
ncbi:MAG: hypothetical protein CVU03_11785 [Bacteroidetes bacterium HGW-Bacteroidetes-2]|jgi:hypothetical protein|nr:MAG: hypothetical protein CVU03_11785 [Bacteroidetes bacterium HGW-Bacteroidetes-2]